MASLARDQKRAKTVPLDMVHLPETGRRPQRLLQILRHQWHRRGQGVLRPPRAAGPADRDHGSFTGAQRQTDTGHSAIGGRPQGEGLHDVVLGGVGERAVQGGD